MTVAHAREGQPSGINTATNLRVQALVDQLLGLPEQLPAEHRDARSAVPDLVVLYVGAPCTARATRRIKQLKQKYSF